MKRVSEYMRGGGGREEGRGGIQEVTRSVRGEEEYAKEKTLFPAAILPSPILTSTPSLSTPLWAEAILPQGTCTLQGGCEDKHAVEEVTELEISRQPLPQPHPLLPELAVVNLRRGRSKLTDSHSPLPPLSDMHNTVHRTLSAI